jgi:hypothetical protein
LFILDPGISFCWDNIQKEVRARHQTSEHGDKFLIWANAFAVLNRIAVDMAVQGPLRTAKEIPLTDILPSPQDFKELHSRLVVMVTRILVECVPYFNDSRDQVVDHIGHMYSDEMGSTSKVVMNNIHCHSLRINIILKAI